MKYISIKNFPHSANLLVHLYELSKSQRTKFLLILQREKLLQYFHKNFANFTNGKVSVGFETRGLTSELRLDATQAIKKFCAVNNLDLQNGTLPVPSNHDN